MRLDKFLCDNTDLTRTYARRELQQGQVTVNGAVVKKGALQLAADDEVAWDGEVITPQGLRYLMLYKPEGYICSNVDELYPSVMNLIQLPAKSQLHVAGRLDADTTGLVLITDDGQWSHRITSPHHACDKVYRIDLAEPLISEAEQYCRDGLMLHGETTPTRPAHLERISETQVLLTIQEGRHHQVKRMMAALGNRVVALHREQVGTVKLDPDLKKAHWRMLTVKEVDALAPSTVAGTP